jgi:heme oxygenase
MIERLNEETRSHHAEADSDFDVLFQAQMTAAHYGTFLVGAYGFEAPLESTLAMTPNLDLMIDLKERTKAGYLAQDLMALGQRPQQIARLPQCLAIPQFEAAAEALGWMYVVERTTLAHSVLRRHLLTRLPREMRTAGNYLGCYGGMVGTRWRTFGSTLDDLARQPGVGDRIVRAANEAFLCQRRWIQQGRHDIRVAI